MSEIINKNFIPETLTDPEKEVWKSVASFLIENDILNSINWRMLERYCILVVQLRTLEKNKPDHYMIDKYNNHIKNLEKELCLTPTSYNRFIKDKLIIKERMEKQEKHKQKAEDIEKEKFFQ